MLALILFIITAAALYQLVIGCVKSVRQEDPFFPFLYSTILFLAAIGVLVYFTFNNFLFLDTNLENVTLQLTILWLISTVVPLIFLIRNTALKKPLTRSIVVSSVSFSMFLIILSLYLSIVLL
ncbi:hypothetical protein SAMN05216216_11253 [Lacicoccus qingdaonensis]|uniref:Uncharacterized protein n=1 Tax=Lacicoccus qingdaonensis TaxID=576118 RepID=A0A1G9FJ94_9BACL|nr:hypothetical protein SAMN05216216_11253 [Salinicoccus qingdaonensis]